MPKRTREQSATVGVADHWGWAVLVTVEPNGNLVDRRRIELVIALRVCPRLPATVRERISNYQAHNVADSVMYRQALARAAQALGWFVHWYSAQRVQADAAKVLDRTSIEDLLENTGSAVGPPWQKDHRMAMAAAIAARAHWKA